MWRYVLACMAASRFRAALTSRSWSAPHRQVQLRSGRLSPWLTAPHAEHVLLDGHQRSAADAFDPDFLPVLTSRGVRARSQARWASPATSVVRDVVRGSETSEIGDVKD